MRSFHLYSSRAAYNHEDNGNENVKKKKGWFYEQNNSSARASRSLAHFRMAGLAQSVERVDCRAGGRGFDCRGRRRLGDVKIVSPNSTFVPNTLTVN